MDIKKGFPAEIILTSEDYMWVQKLDYKNLLFWCQAYYKTCHLAKNYPKATHYSSRRGHCKSTLWECVKIEYDIVFKNLDSPLDIDNVAENLEE